MMDRSEKVLAYASELYHKAPTSMGEWMWRHHTQWVAGKAKQLAEKYGADAEIVYCAALLHDVADAKFERDYADFDAWSWDKAKEVLKNSGFRKVTRDQILEAIRTHSCHPGQLPTALEGRVLATADAMWHLQTNFFPVICYMNRPDNTHAYEEWQNWFVQKIQRDYDTKIFFGDEKSEVKADYEALLRVFSNQTLSS
jgi:HD superfamily phosphodiesterase